MVGEKSPDQCTWGFINGIRNTREEAIESSNLISEKAENELVVSLRNDQVLWGVKEASVALLLKMGIDTPVVKNAVLFFVIYFLYRKIKEIPQSFYLLIAKVRPLLNMLSLCFLSKRDRKFEFLRLEDGLLSLQMLLIQTLIIMQVSGI